MILLWLVFSFLALVTIWVIPELAKIAAEKTTKWVAAGQNPPFRHHFIKTIFAITFLLMSAFAIYFSQGRDVVVHTPFDKMGNQLFYGISILAIVAAVISVCLLINHILRAIASYMHPPAIEGVSKPAQAK